MFRRLIRCNLAFPFLLLSAACTPVPAPGQDSASNVPIVISDFELSASAAAPVLPAANPNDPAKKPAPKDAPPAVFESSDIPSVQARRLMDFFSATLVQSFSKAGYSATRLTGSNPSSGVLLRGVFAEPDPSNRIRRALLGGGVPGAKLMLYVGTFNLARPDQPLYQPASTQPPDVRFGPIITLNNYIPLAKFELSKNPTEDEVRKICALVVQNLSTLLKTNPEAFSQ